MADAATSKKSPHRASSACATQHHAATRSAHAKRTTLCATTSFGSAIRHVAVAKPASVAPHADLRVGIVANTSGYGGDSLAPEMAKVAADTGVRWMREELDWSTIEPTRGIWDWSHYDTLFAAAANQHIQILPMLMSAPSWAEPTTTTIPDDPSDYADFVAHLVARYGPHGSFWTTSPEGATYAPSTFEIWNEPFYPAYNAGDYNPGRFARLMKAATIAGRAADPAAKFLMPVSEASGHVDGSSDWSDWIPSLYAAVPDLNDYYDAVAVHPYGTDLQDRRYGFAQVDAIHHDLAAHNAADKQEWITEVGYSTCTGGDDCVSESQQAADMRSDLKKVTTADSSFVAGIFFYRYSDLGTADPTDMEQNMGLTHLDGSAKAGLSVLQDAAAASSR